jgi:hypothetical protein
MAPGARHRVAVRKVILLGQVIRHGPNFQNKFCMRFAVGDLVGLCALAVIVSALAVAVPASEVTSTLWAAAFLALGFIGVWHRKSSPSRPKVWLHFLAVVLLMDAGSFCVDVVLGHLVRPQLSLIDGATHLGGPFGFAATAILIPAVFFVGLAGFVRSIFLLWTAHA